MSSEVDPAGAIFSPCNRYRYTLWRRWLTGTGTCVFVMLNPSTADASHDDPTVRRCIGFAKAWGFRELEVVNLFALRATDPREIYTACDPIGRDNTWILMTQCKLASFIVAAWGAHGEYQGRGAEVLRRLKEAGLTVHELGRTKAGHPKHPLYLSASTLPKPIPDGSSS